MPASSIRARLLLLAGGLIALALLAAWFVLSALLADFVTRRLTSELNAVGRAILASAEWDDTSTFSIIAQPGDQRFETPYSGWYWQVSSEGTVLARSPSLLTGKLNEGRDLTGPKGEPLLAITRQFTAPGDDRLLDVIVTLPDAERNAELSAITKPLGMALCVLGASLVLALGVSVSGGLVELRRFAAEVGLLREGRVATLSRPQATELIPLADELNRLISANRMTLARARAHVGNLAHALKTPLSVLLNRADGVDRDLLLRMERQVRWHLKRARAAGTSDTLKATTDIGSVLDDLLLIFKQAANHRGIVIDIKIDKAPLFAGEAEDLAEMTGNLLENACKWASRRISVVSNASPDGRLFIAIEDDGPGIPTAERQAVLTRGERLDEATPGSGLGLAIVADLVQLYGGELHLEEACQGGLRTVLLLPSVSRS